MRMMGGGLETGRGGEVCWGCQSTSGPTKTEMSNGPFPEGKLWKGSQNECPPLTLSAGHGTLVQQHLSTRAHSPGIRPAQV